MVQWLHMFWVSVFFVACHQKQMERRAKQNMPKSLLESASYKCSVSSVLNKDVKQYGKQFLFDNTEDTAWSSNEGLPQWIALIFDEPQAIKEFSFQFQGGFAGKDSKIIIENENGNILTEEPFYPDDINSVQKFTLKNKIETPIAKKIKFIFNTSTDFFGRIIVYRLELF